jgi:Spy/CpxP family protein refolding chaperone
MITRLVILATLMTPLSVRAQSTAARPATPETGTFSVQTAGPGGPGRPGRMMIRREMGKWWKNSDIAKKLQLNENQVTQLDQVYYEHRLKLIDYGAEMEKEDLKMQNLLDADVPNEGQINMQVDQVLSARGKLEREYTMMNLDLRKVLSVDQWRQLRSIRGTTGLGGNIMYFHKKIGAPGGPGLPPLPPPPPGGGGDEPL